MSIEKLPRSVEKRVQLREGERVRKIFRRSLWFYFWPIIVSTLLVVGSFFLLYPLFKYGIPGITVFCGLLVMGLLSCLRIYVSFSSTVFVLTNIHIIDVDRKGFFGTIVTVAPYDKVDDVIFRQRGVQNLFKLGDIYITLVGKNEATLKLSDIESPQVVVSELLEYQSRHQTRNSHFESSEFLLRRIKRKIGDEAFNKLIAD